MIMTQGPEEYAGGHWPGAFAGHAAEVTAEDTSDDFYWSGDARLAYDNYDGNPEHAACEQTVRGGRCTSCEEDAPELYPTGGGQRICGRCWDASMDLLAKAVSEAFEGTVFVTAQRAESTVAA